MATWEPHKVKMRPVDMVPIAVPDNTCFWCNQSIQHGGGSTTWIDWAANGDFGCESNPRTCDNQGFHFHGWDIGGTNAHTPKEAVEEGMSWPEEEWDGLENSGEHCVVGNHQTIEQVAQLVEGGWHNDLLEDAQDAPVPDVEAHCDNGNCGSNACHICSPNPSCFDHPSCINLRSCDECGADKHNVELIWSEDAEHDAPKTAYVPSNVCAGEQLRKKYPRSMTLHNHGITMESDSGSVYNYVYNTVGQEWDVGHLYDVVQNTNLVCKNRDCNKFNIVK